MVEIRLLVFNDGFVVFIVIIVVNNFGRRRLRFVIAFRSDTVFLSCDIFLLVKVELGEVIIDTSLEKFEN